MKYVFNFLPAMLGLALWIIMEGSKIEFLLIQLLVLVCNVLGWHEGNLGTREGEK